MDIPATARVFALLATSFFAAASEAAPERASASLEWKKSAPAAECLDGESLATAVESALHRKVFVDQSLADFVIRVSLDRVATERWSATIDLKDPGGRKLGHRELTVQAAQCSAINESLALMVSLMADVSRESVRAPAPVDAAASKREKDEPRQVIPREAAPDAHWHKLFYLLGSSRVGQLPGFGRGITLQGELGSPQGWSAFMSATAWAPAETSVEAAGAKYRLLTADTNVCAVTRTEWRANLAWCFGQQLGRLDARAFGFDVNRKQATVLYDLTLRIRMTWWATSVVGLHLGLGAAFPLAQEEFYGTRADGSTVRLMSRPIVVPLADLGLGLRFGQ